ncbi:MAG: DUF6297 family protein [Specibacter sp.]
MTPAETSPATRSTTVMGKKHDFDPVAFTRNAFNKHRTTSRWGTVGDVYQSLLGAAVILMYAGSLFYGIQQDLVVDAGWFLTRPIASAHLWPFPASVAMSLMLLLGSAYGVVLACRTGPVATSRAQGYWWLSLPTDRRKLALGPIAKKLLWTGSVAGLCMAPVAALSSPAHGVSSVILACLTAVFLGALIIASAVALQISGRQRIVETCARAVSAGILLALLLPTVIPRNDEFLAALTPVLQVFPSSWPLVVAHGRIWPLFAMFTMAVLGCAWAYTGLGRLYRADLVAAGGITGHASSALYFADFRELGQALRTDSGGRKRFNITTWVPKSPAGVLVFADVVAFMRKPQTVGTLVVLGLLPGATTLIEGLGSAIIVVTVLFLTGWRVAVTSSTIAQQYADRPALDRLLPLGATAQLRLHAVVPVLATIAWSALSFGLLALLGASSEGFSTSALLGMGMLSGVGLAGAAMRMAYRPAPDWASVEGTMLTVLQSNGIIESYTRGPDFVVLAMLPTLLALVTGTLTVWLLVLQIVTSLFCLWFATRRH